MASFGQIIFYSMIALIILFGAALVIFFIIAFSSNDPGAISRNTKPIANMGDDEILDCSLYNDDAGVQQYSRVSVTWEKKGLDGLVYQYEDGAPQLQNQASQFKGRAHLFPEVVSNGNASLMLRRVRRSDEGEYVCSIKSADTSGKVSIHLKTAAYTAPTFKLSDGVLTAVANRWFPEPNVTWLNESGIVLNASTSIEDSQSGIFRVSSSLQSFRTYETYICSIENTMVITVGEATVTDTEVFQRAYYMFNLAPRLLASVQLNALTALMFVCFVT